MAKFIEKKFRCSKCGQESEHAVLLGYTILPNMDLDLRQYARGINLLNFGIQKCPHCHYCNNNIERSIGNNISFSNEYKEVLNDFEINDLAKKYILAALLNEQNTNEHEAVMLYLQAAWVYDDLNNQKIAEFYRIKAANLLIKYLEENTNAEDIILLVDILRRIEEFDQALNIISMLKDTLIDLYAKIISFEEQLILNKDSNAHKMGEATNE